MEQIPKEIRWGDRTITESVEKASAFAEYFNTKTTNIVEQNAVQNGLWNGGRVLDAEEANYITMQKTEDT